MPPGAHRYGTPPATRPAPQNRLIEQTPRHQGDESRYGAPTMRSQHRAATPPPPSNQHSAHRNVDQAAQLTQPHPAHAPIAEAPQRAAPRPPAVHAASVPRSHQPAYESHHHGAAHTSHRPPVMSTQPAGIPRLPTGFATLPLLPSAGAPVRAGRYTSPSVRRHTSLPTTISAHTYAASAPRASRQAENALATRRNPPPRTARASTCIDRLCTRV